MDGPPVFSAGQVLDRKYRVERVIRQGGMGTVLLALHEELDQRVAVKVLDSQLASDPQVLARFVREARATAKLQSDHVVRVTDVGAFDGVGPYLVMEHLEGLDLRDRLAQGGAMDVHEAVDCVLAAIDAVAEAHSLGIIHRDLKPSNLFLAERADGSKILKVLDFGISKMRAAGGPGEGQDLTQARAMLGSPSYMSPEQIMCSRDVDPRTDIWSLGVVLYELLTDALPFEGENLFELARNILNEKPRPLREVRPDLPPALEITIARCLQSNPEQRFATVAEMARALAPFGSERAQATVDRAVSLFRRRLPSLVTEDMLGEGSTHVMTSPIASGPSSPRIPRISGVVPRTPAPVSAPQLPPAEHDSTLSDPEPARSRQTVAVMLVAFVLAVEVALITYLLIGP